MPSRGEENLIDRLRHLSEEGLASLVSELGGRDGVRRALGRAGERLTANKGRFDRNIETVLDFVNIPSKRDVRELKTRLDYLNGQIVNLNLKLDRFLGGAKPAPRLDATPQRKALSAPRVRTRRSKS